VQPPAIRSMGLPTDYSSIFEEAITALHAEKRFRVFADLKRIAGRFPYAL
jgi:5-aminolevulinate synthase